MQKNKTVFVSHGVLDLMSFEISKLACNEAARVIKPNGFFLL